MTLLENIRTNLGTALLALALLLPVPLPAAPALIMPRASESLLLDITVAGERVLAVGEQGHILSATMAADAGCRLKYPRARCSPRFIFRHPSEVGRWGMTA